MRPNWSVGDSAPLTLGGAKALGEEKVPEADAKKYVNGLERSFCCASSEGLCFQSLDPDG